MPSAPSSTRSDRLPPRLLPLLYFGLAHVCLAAAWLTVALDPHGVAGFFYHPRMVFVVHLVTLGWITSSILGALYLVGPMALATPMPAEGGDWASFVLYLLGGSGVVFHFWIDELSGVGLSGILVLLAVAQVAAKFLTGLASSRVPVAVKAHFVLAFVNFAVAAFMGMLLAFNKLFAFLPGYVLTNVSAHAHLAALGWATMMIFAAGYRLMPMFLPSAMPQGKGVWASAVIFEAGLAGLFVALAARSPWRAVFAAVTAAGIAVFFAQVVWMRRHPRPAPKKLKRPDWGVFQALSALAYLALAVVLGLVLAFSETARASSALVMLYGTCALVGFLAQIVAGMSGRLVPIYAWMRASLEAPPARTPHDLPHRGLQAAAFFLWSAGVPALALGLTLNLASLLSVGGWTLLAAVLAGAANIVRVIRVAPERPDTSEVSARQDAASSETDVSPASRPLVD